jgi:hypothetical protein
LAGPLGRGIAQAAHADAARQSSLNGSLHEFRREERERDRHIDLRMLHLSRAAICSTLVTVPATISSSQRRPRAMDETSVTRVSARIGRGSCPDSEAGTMISRRRFIGVFFHGTCSTGRSSFTVGRIVGCLCLQLDRQLVCLDLDADDVVANEVSVISPLLTRGCVATLRDGKGQSQLAIGQDRTRKQGASHRAVAPKWRATVDEDRHFYFAIPL